MVRSMKSFCCLALLANLSTAVRPAPLQAQTEASRRWTLSSTFTALGGGGLDRWLFGPELAIRYDVGREWGLGLRAALPVLDSAPYSDDGAIALDLGPTWTRRSSRGELGLQAGATAFLVGDRGELRDGGIGPFVSAFGTRWLSSGLGVAGGATVRIGASGGVFTGVSAGLSFRL